MENQSLLHIARSGKKLGVFSAEQVMDGLKSGLFRPSDHYWQAAGKTWETLDKLHPGLGAPSPPPIPVANKETPKVTGVGGGIFRAILTLSIIAGVLIFKEAYRDLKPIYRPPGIRGEAQEYYRQAVGICKSLEGDRGSMMAVLLCHGTFSATDPEIADIKKAMPFLIKAAEKGHRDAQYFAGSVLKLDSSSKVEAEAFLLRAAKQGHPLASRVLSTDYLLRPEIFGRKLEDGVTWHLITPPSLREPRITDWVSNGDGPAFTAARKRAAEFRPILEWPNNPPVSK